VVIDGWEQSASQPQRKSEGKLATMKCEPAVKWILLATVIIQFAAE
jgi:hypothetical protein